MVKKPNSPIDHLIISRYDGYGSNLRSAQPLHSTFRSSAGCPHDAAAAEEIRDPTSQDCLPILVRNAMLCLYFQ